MRPFFTPSNPVYQALDEERTEALFSALKTIADIFHPNEPGSHALLSDDMLIWFRNISFLSEERFEKACEGFESSAFVRAKLYRIYLYCWAVEQSPEGLAFDLGTYDGKTVQIADRYTNHKMTWCLFDAFSHHPTGENKQKHGYELIGEVKKRVEGAHIFCGMLPDSLSDGLRGPISFLHVDLNDQEAESKCLDKLFDRIVPGGVILLDDYGWARYQDSYDAHSRFFKERGQNVLCLPTGQGMIIKR